MAKNKKNASPLFEIIRRAEQPARREIRLPPWMRRRPTESRGPERPPSPEERPRTEATEHPRPAETGGDGPRTGAADRVADAKAWLRRPLVVRLPRGTVIMLAAAAAVVVVIAYMVGYQVGDRRALAYRENVREMGASVSDIREGPVTAPLPASVAGVGEGAGGAAGGGASGADGDPREPGLNYFRLEYLPASAREEAEQAVAFLERNGVDAALIPSNNGRSLKLIALPGFSRPRSDPAAEELRDRLLSLGRKWKSQQEGASDWNDLFAEKYLPDHN